jgi:GT2 family glycosyltransferase
VSALQDPRVSVIVATYEWPQALDVMLEALSDQRGRAFEVIVADDGSGAVTRTIVERWQPVFDGRVHHSWQPDAGYRRARSLNLAVLGAAGDYLVILDGDCLPRRGFLEAVRRAALPGWFVASKRLNLRAGLSRRVLEQHLPVWRWSTARWFATAPRELFSAPREVARPGLLLPLRDRRRPWRPEQPDFAPPFDGYGFCLGVARRDLERVNGFDMRFTGWGGEDVDLAVRLRRAGLRCGWPGAGATVLHLWHAERKGRTSSNRQLVEETESSSRVEAIEGLRELALEVGGEGVEVAP